MRRIVPLIAALALSAAAHATPLEPSDYLSFGDWTASSGLWRFDTNALTLTLNGTPVVSGVLQSQGPGLPDIAVFTFDGIDVTGTASISFTGSRPIALLSKGDILISPNLGASSFGTPILGGGSGGAGGVTSGAAGGGIGGGAGGVARLSGGGGGGHGGTGQGSTGISGGAGGPSYGDLALALQAGSGGGGAAGDPAIGAGGNGGHGGGAIEIGALGTIQLGRVSASGGEMAVGNQFGGGGGGSGGAVLIHGSSISGEFVLAQGGPRHDNGEFRGGAGAGGRVHLVQDSYSVADALPGVNVRDGFGLAFGLGAGVASIAPGLTIVPGGVAFDLVDGKVSDNQYAITIADLAIDSGGLAFTTGAYTARGDVSLFGGILAAPGGITFDADKRLLGFGSVAGPVSGGAASVLAATGGPLTLGDATRADGFAWAGTTNVGPSAILQLQDADKATLGASTTLSAGSRLASLNGIELASGQVLSTASNATVEGDFTNQGTVAGPTLAGRLLTFTGDVNGAGSYSGNVAFSDGFMPGNSPGEVHFDGNATFDSTSTIFMEIGADGYDKILVTGLLTLGGALDVDFWQGYTPDGGEVFDLFDWGSRSGTFSFIDLPSLQHGLFWDTSALYTSGALSVNAIPEPQTYALLLAGLGLLGFAARRQRRDCGATPSTTPGSAR